MREVASSTKKVRRLLEFALVCTLIGAGAALAAASPEATPNFSQGINFAWRGVGAFPYLIPSSTGPQPVTVDSAIFNKDHPFDPATMWPVVDPTNPNLQPRTVEALRAQNERVRSGQPVHFPLSSCWPPGVMQMHLLSPVRPLYFVQKPDEVLIISQYNNEARRILLNRQHSPNPKPSWYGESIGHYENGDTLVVDTIRTNGRTQLDALHTPHTSDLHLIERFKLTEDGRSMNVKIRIEDPGAFKAAYEVTRPYRLVEDPWPEFICAEKTDDPLNQGLEPIPQATKPDF